MSTDQGVSITVRTPSAPASGPASPNTRGGLGVPQSAPGRPLTGRGTPTRPSQPSPVARWVGRWIGRAGRWLLGGNGGDKAIVVGLIAVLIIAFGGSPTSVAGNDDPEAAATPTRAANPAPGGGGKVTDPTGTGGKVTATTAHALAQLVEVFGPLRGGPTLRSAACWDRHAWNPTSDHPLGKGCDLVPVRIGTAPAGADLDHGWQIANWLRANAKALHVKYLIFQGREWSITNSQDTGGWGHVYRSRIYGCPNPREVTGCHYDHVHVSFTD